MSKPQNYYQNRRPEIMDFIDRRPKNVLELGCGQGYFGKSLKDQYGCRVTGIEINKLHARSAMKILDTVFSMSAEEAIKKLGSNRYDLIVANDVLEHLEDPYDLLRKLKNNLAKKGQIISSIPNVRNFHVVYALLKNKQWKYTESGILDFTHLRFFTSESIIEMYQNNGYKVLRQEGINKDNNLPWWFKFVNLVSRGKFEDMAYLQFVTISEKK